MQRRSPPKHRHDGTSPLPLGMDWSPPPRKWHGRDTVWPHDPRTGWSYCVTIPSWVVLPKSRDSDPVVFYRVQVGLQSPEGITTTRGVLRRFNHFLKLFNDLRKAFPKKNLPPAPPKGLLRMKSRTLLEERRCSLEEWVTKLLSDIDISRSVSVASFLELEAAARSSFLEVNHNSLEANSSGSSTVPSFQMPTHSSSALTASSSVTSDYGSDTAYETSEVGTPRLGRDDGSENGIEDLALDEDVTNPIEKLVKYGMSNIDEGLFMGQTILEQLEGFPRHKTHARQHFNNVIGKDTYNGHASKASFLAGDGMDLFSEPEPAKVIDHTRKLSSESVRSDTSSLRGSEMSNSGVLNSSVDGSLDFYGCTEISSTMELGNTNLQFSGDGQVVIPMDQRHKLNRALLTMERRLVTAKTDMEDLIVRLNQEIAVKEYLMTKVKDLEVELETSKQKSKENLQQAILSERERFTQMQWDMEELRRKALEMEWKLKSRQDAQSDTVTTKESASQEKEAVLQELDATKQQLEVLSKQYEELDAKSKADIKVLVKEVKSLRSSHKGLKQELSQVLNEKSETEELLQQERETSDRVKTARKKLLHKCGILHSQFQECNTNLLAENTYNSILESSSLADALELLNTSDHQIALLHAEAERLAEDDEATAHDANDDTVADVELRKMITDIFIENSKLRKQVNRVIRSFLLSRNKDEDEDEAASENVSMNKSPER
ncbi:PX domain-containing protein EREL2-like isoform X2 [Mangifera indica]|uniref:PX domain-containing protein EREL2-like isoform X2 n=1 Tax=Mangifera indica TaxID=29780 RepID=UPI001CFAB55F|nr:PX domain-containing protein EREL2-like isoform X2 [Mangifera indica]